MPDFDAGFKIVARSAGRRLAQLANVRCGPLEPVGGEVQAAERLADRAFRTRQGKHQFLIYMEAYTRWNPPAPWSILSKSGLLAERERLPVVSLVYILQPQGYRAQGGMFRLQVGKKPTQQGVVRGSLSLATVAATVVGAVAWSDGAVPVVPTSAAGKRSHLPSGPGHP